jgi:hypothetical protein
MTGVIFLTINKCRPVLACKGVILRWRLIRGFKPVHFGKTIHLNVKESPMVNLSINEIILVAFNMAKCPLDGAVFKGRVSGRKQIKLATICAGIKIFAEYLHEGAHAITSTDD